MDFRTGKIEPGKPLVTIGVLSYNYSKYVVAALDSLLSQTYSHIELVIVDDCSSEDTVNRISNWIKTNNIHCTFIVNTTNEGITRVSNKIVSLANGKYLNLFATDDIMLSEKIEKQVEILELVGDDFGMCYANVQTMDEDGNPLGLYVNNPEPFLPEGDVLEPFIYRTLSFATPSALIRKSAYSKCGLYDERVLIEDYNFWLRFFACFKAKVCEYPCLIYRVKKQSDIFDQWNANNNERYFHDRIISNILGLRYIKEKHLRKYLRKKINQYLKSLYFHNSKYARGLTFFCIKNGHYQIPMKHLVKKLVA